MNAGGVTAVAVCGCGAETAVECLHARGGIAEPELGCVAARRVVTASEFAAVDEAGAASVLGDPDTPLIVEGSNVMVYGDGGTGKTTLCVDLAFHLAAGNDWIGIAIPRRLRCLFMENEGPRPPFRRKIGRKLIRWEGSPVGDRLLILENPWAQFTFADLELRDWLAGQVSDRDLDVVFIGPITSSGMDEAGTMQEVRAFDRLVDDVRHRAGRPVVFVLVHHENKGGKVSGAWEGVGDTLLHVLAQGHGKLRLYVQKARWASSLHQTGIQLAWADGEGFVRVDQEAPRPERTWNDIAEYVLEHGGTGWVTVEKAVPGQGDYLRRRRDQMLEEGLLINAGAGQKFELWHRDDPAKPTLDTTVSEGGHGSDTAVSGTGDEGRSPNRVPCPPLRGTREGTRLVPASPGEPETDDAGAGPAGRRHHE